jgi:hypothetical protein
MQLTNILRDVGEDWDAGRLYLPRALLARHGLDGADIASMRAGAPILRGYRALVEEVIAVADGAYDAAFRAIPALPPFARRPIAVAAHVYRGIHDAIRANGYDNLTRRAHTRRRDRIRLAGRALLDLRSAGVAAGLQSTGNHAAHGPGFREDFQECGRLLPSARDRFAGARYETPRFLLDHGAPAPETRIALERLESIDG